MSVVSTTLTRPPCDVETFRAAVNPDFRKITVCTTGTTSRSSIALLLSTRESAVEIFEGKCQGIIYRRRNFTDDQKTEEVGSWFYAS